jgi:hypothetical protein
VDYFHHGEAMSSSNPIDSTAYFSIELMVQASIERYAEAVAEELAAVDNVRTKQAACEARLEEVADVFLSLYKTMPREAQNKIRYKINMYGK